METKDIPNEVKEDSFIEFGRYPQSRILDENLLSVLKELNPVEDDCGWFDFQGKTYVRKGDSFYLVEPIRFYVVRVDSKKKVALLLSEKILTNTSFILKKQKPVLESGEIPSNLYLHSNLRFFLNSLDGTAFGCPDYTETGFFSKAFTEEERKKISIQRVDNSFHSVVPEGYDEDTEETKKTNDWSNDSFDPVFALSFQEITSISIHNLIREEGHRSFPCDIRRSSATDFSSQIGLLKNVNLHFTRSPRYDRDGSVTFLDSHGIGHFTKATSLCGVRPALYLSLV